jgi:hypothetical protein
MKETKTDAKALKSFFWGGGGDLYDGQCPKHQSQSLLCINIRNLWSWLTVSGLTNMQTL